MLTQSLSWRIPCGGVAFGRPLIGSVLGSGFAAPAPVRPTSRSTCCARAGIAQEPMNTDVDDVLAWWKLRDHNEAADPSSGRPEGLLTSLAWSVSGWAHQPRRLVLSVSSPRRAACTTTSRARWRGRLPGALPHRHRQQRVVDGAWNQGVWRLRTGTKGLTEQATGTAAPVLSMYRDHHP